MPTMACQCRRTTAIMQQSRKEKERNSLVWRADRIRRALSAAKPSIESMRWLPLDPGCSWLAVRAAWQGPWGHLRGDDATNIALGSSAPAAALARTDGGHSATGSSTSLSFAGARSPRGTVTQNAALRGLRGCRWRLRRDDATPPSAPAANAGGGRRRRHLVEQMVGTVRKIVSR